MIARGLIDFAVRDLTDVDGRPVAEVAAAFYASVPTELQACPYPDARLGMPMNRSALRQMTAEWPALLACFSGMAGPTPTVHEAWRAAVWGIALPLVAEQPTSRRVAGLFKACLGLTQVFSALLLGADGVADMPLTALGDGEAFFAELDRGRWLIGAEQACAGTRPMIVAVFDAMCREGDAPADVAALLPRVEAAPTAVALHLAWLAARQRAARRGEGEPVTESLHPWLRATFAVPDRAPEHARRLFPTGRAPEALERFLASDRSSAAFEAEI